MRLKTSMGMREVLFRPTWRNKLEIWVDFLHAHIKCLINCPRLVVELVTSGKEVDGKPKLSAVSSSGVSQTQATIGVPILDSTHHMFGGMPEPRMVAGSAVEDANYAQSHPTGRGGVQKWADIVGSREENYVFKLFDDLPKSGASMLNQRSSGSNLEYVASKDPNFPSNSHFHWMVI
ncbi:hypothetical protein U1Q18_017975 [Sarracenia purpurea var. burkii]